MTGRLTAPMIFRCREFADGPFDEPAEPIEIGPSGIDQDCAALPHLDQRKRLAALAGLRCRRHRRSRSRCPSPRPEWRRRRTPARRPARWDRRAKGRLRRECSPERKSRSEKIAEPARRLCRSMMSLIWLDAMKSSVSTSMEIAVVASVLTRRSAVTTISSSSRASCADGNLGPGTSDADCSSQHRHSRRLQRFRIHTFTPFMFR